MLHEESSKNFPDEALKASRRKLWKLPGVTSERLPKLLSFLECFFGGSSERFLEEAHEASKNAQKSFVRKLRMFLWGSLETRKAFWSKLRMFLGGSLEFFSEAAPKAFQRKFIMFPWESSKSFSGKVWKAPQNKPLKKAFFWKLRCFF